MSKQSSFISKVAPGAQAAMKSRGVLASLTIAQAILESGWGKHAPGNNMFGIKAYGWSGKTQLLTTTEFIGGKTVTIKDVFRAYSSLAESIEDHAAFLVKNSRYKNLIGVANYKSVCVCIKADGYATEQDYTQQLISIIEEYKLYKYDVLPAQVIVDAPKQGATCNGDILVGGWAIAAKGVARVDIYVDGRHGLASIGTFSERPDVAKAVNRFGWYKNAGRSGYTCIVPSGKIKKGRHTIDVAAIGCDKSATWAHRPIVVR